MPLYNKVIYAGKTLIDLSADTITEDKVLFGYTGHKADGSQFIGTAFEGCPSSYDYTDVIEDSSGNPILDSDSNDLIGRTVYRKFEGFIHKCEFMDTIEDSSGNLILDSSGNAIEGRTVYLKI